MKKLPLKQYIRYRCFGVEVDLEAEHIKRHLRDPHLQEAIAAFLSRQIAQLSTEERAIEFEDASFQLSHTQPFTWRRKHIACKKTVFNECAVYNELEERFAQFLDKASDVLRFAALAESYTRFRVDYLNPNGAIKLYYPDFVAVQKTPAGEVNWIIETKGREYENVLHKDQAIKTWCSKINQQTHSEWRYVKIPQYIFDKFKKDTLEDLLIAIEGMQSEPNLL